MSEDFRLKFAEIIQRSYKNCFDRTIIAKNCTIPLVEINSSFFGDRIVSLPFLDTSKFFGEISDENIDSIINMAGSKKIEIRLGEIEENISKIRKLLTKRGFIESNEKNHIISILKPENEMWDEFHKHTRNDIRKAIKSELKLVNIESIQELSNFYKLYLKNMRNFGTPQHSFNFFKNYFEFNCKNFFGINCYFSEKLIASIVIFYGSDYAYVSFNVSDPKYRNMRPNDLIYWEAIKWCIKNKIKYFDIGQIDFNPIPGSREESLLRFKQKWLGKEYKKLTFTFNSETNIGPKKNKLKKFRKIWRMLPSCITKFLGPKICSQLGV